MKRLIVLVVAIALCVCLCGCFGGKSEGLESYVGKTYSATSPWGEDMSITVDKYNDGAVDLTYKENIDAEHSLSCALTNNKLTDNAATLTLKGKQSSKDYDVEYEYELKIAFKGGNIELTYLDGQKSELSEEGGSSFHHAAALEDDEATVVLKSK